MKKYRVGFWYCIYASTNVMAHTKEEAEIKTKKCMDTIDFSGSFKYDTNDRDVGVIEPEEIE
jgi:hypothetical protein